MPNEDFGLELAKEAISTVAKSTYDDVAHPTLHAIVHSSVYHGKPLMLH